MLDIELDAIEQRCDETGKLLEDTKRLITEVKRLREQEKYRNTYPHEPANITRITEQTS